MFSFYITLIVIFSIFLIILALLQNSKRDNSSGNIIGSMGANQLIGIKETTDILTKMTLFFIFAIFILSIFSYRSIRKNDRIEESPNLDIAKKYSDGGEKKNVKENKKEQNDENVEEEKKDNVQNENKNNNE